MLNDERIRYQNEHKTNSRSSVKTKDIDCTHSCCGIILYLNSIVSHCAIQSFTKFVFTLPNSKFSTRRTRPD